MISLILISLRWARWHDCVVYMRSRFIGRRCQNARQQQVANIIYSTANNILGEPVFVWRAACQESISVSQGFVWKFLLCSLPRQQCSAWIWRFFPNIQTFPHTYQTHRQTYDWAEKRFLQKLRLFGLKDENIVVQQVSETAEEWS